MSHSVDEILKEINSRTSVAPTVKTGRLSSQARRAIDEQVNGNILLQNSRSIREEQRQRRLANAQAEQEAKANTPTVSIYDNVSNPIQTPVENVNIKTATGDTKIVNNSSYVNNSGTGKATGINNISMEEIKSSAKYELDNAVSNYNDYLESMTGKKPTTQDNKPTIAKSHQDYIKEYDSLPYAEKAKYANALEYANTKKSNDTKALKDFAKNESEKQEAFSKVSNTEEAQKLQKEIRDAQTKSSIANYQYDLLQAQFDYDSRNALENTLSLIYNTATSMFDGFDNPVYNEDGEKYFLGSSGTAYKNTILSNTDGALGVFYDYISEATKMGVEGLVSLIPGAGQVLGTSLYYSDIVMDQYNSKMANGYSKEDAFNFALADGLVQYYSDKLFGAGGKVYGDGGFVQNKLINGVTSKFIGNKLVRNVVNEGLANYGSEYIQEWLGEIDEDLFLKHLSPGETVQDIVDRAGEINENAMYSGFIGLLTGSTAKVGQTFVEAGFNGGFENLRIKKQTQENVLSTINSIERVNGGKLSENNKALIYDIAYNYEAYYADTFGEDYKTDIMGSVPTEAQLNDIYNNIKRVKINNFRNQIAKLSSNPELSQEQRNQLAEIQRKGEAIILDTNLNLNLIYSAKRDNGSLVYNPDTIFGQNTTLNVNVNSNESFAGIIDHELSHYFSSEKTQNFVLDYMKNKIEDNGKSMYENRREALLAEGAYTPGKIDDELVARQIGELCQSDEFLGELVDYNPSVFERAKNFIDNISYAFFGNDNDSNYVKMLRNQFKNDYKKQSINPNLEKGTYNYSHGTGTHFGDGGKGRDSNYFSMHTSNRSTGHFGTGVYFYGDVYNASASHKARPSIEMDVNGYNLLEPNSNQEGFEIHDGLRQINHNPQLIGREIKGKNISNKIIEYQKNGDIETLNSIVQDLEEFNINVDNEKNDIENGYEYEASKSIIDKAEDLTYEIELANNEFNKLKKIMVKDGIRPSTINKAVKKIKTLDTNLSNADLDTQLESPTLSTIFMQELGYEGIDVRELDQLDNGSYGSVIYDYQGRKEILDIFKNEETIKDIIELEPGKGKYFPYSTDIEFFKFPLDVMDQLNSKASQKASSLYSSKNNIDSFTTYVNRGNDTYTVTVDVLKDNSTYNILNAEKTKGDVIDNVKARTTDTSNRFNDSYTIDNTGTNDRSSKSNEYKRTTGENNQLFEDGKEYNNGQTVVQSYEDSWENVREQEVPFSNVRKYNKLVEKTLKSYEEQGIENKKGVSLSEYKKKIKRETNKAIQEIKEDKKVAEKASNKPKAPTKKVEAPKVKENKEFKVSKEMESEAIDKATTISVQYKNGEKNIDAVKKNIDAYEAYEILENGNIVAIQKGNKYYDVWEDGKMVIGHEPMPKNDKYRETNLTTDKVDIPYFENIDGLEYDTLHYKAEANVPLSERISEELARIKYGNTKNLLLYGTEQELFNHFKGLTPANDLVDKNANHYTTDADIQKMVDNVLEMRGEQPKTEQVEVQKAPKAEVKKEKVVEKKENKPKTPKKDVKVEEKKANDIKIPKSTSQFAYIDDLKRRKTYKSIIESDYQSKEAKQKAKQLFETDEYTVYSNKKAVENADNLLQNNNPDDVLKSLIVKVNNNEVNASTIATGERLIQYYSKIGDDVRLHEALQTTALAGTIGGQTVQAMKLIKKQSPQGQAVFTQKVVDLLNKELEKKGSKQRYTFTPEMEKMIVNSTPENLAENVNQVEKMLGNQVYQTFGEKLDEFRYFSMLSNLATHERNFVGNTSMNIIQKTKYQIQGALEDIIIRDKGERTVSFKGINDKYIDFAENDVQNPEVLSMLDIGDNKYMSKQGILSQKRHFKSQLLNNTLGKAYDLNNKLLSGADAYALKRMYTDSLARYLSANKINLKNATQTQLNKARQFAVQEAKLATFHQESKLATQLDNLEKSSKVGKVALGALVPFKKTPINVAKTGFDYSAVGLTKTILGDTYKLKTGQININQYIDNISKGLTGTLITAVGFAMANAGILRVSNDDDEQYQNSLGNQSYSITIGDYNISLDWLSPTAIPLFMGAQLQQEVEKFGKLESLTAEQTAQALTDMGFSFLNPMSEMTMIQGFTSLLNDISYSNNKLEALISSPISSYATQFMPSLYGKIAKTLDPYERSTTSTSTTLVGKIYDKIINSYKSKTILGRQSLPVKTDVWGNEIKQNDNVLLRAINNIANPAKITKVNSNPVDNEIQGLYQLTGETGVIPKTSYDKKYTNKGQTYELSESEYASTKQAISQANYESIKKIINTKAYKELSNEDKVQVIKDIYSYNKKMAEYSYYDNHKISYEVASDYKTTMKIEKDGGDVGEYLSYKASLSGKDDNTKTSVKASTLKNSGVSDKTKDIIISNYIIGSNSDGVQALYKLLKENNIVYDDYLDYLSQSFESDKDDNGDTIRNSKKEKISEYLNNSNLTYYQKLLLAEMNFSNRDNQQDTIYTLISNSETLTYEEKRALFKSLKGFTVKGDTVSW